LSKHLLNVSRLDTLEQLAERGDLSRIDLSVGDIAGGPVGNLPADATASNFGKLSSDVHPEDKARALVNMIAEVIVVLSVTAARANELSEIVLTGKLVRIKTFLDRIQATRLLFERRFVIPEHADFATAIGAARSLRD
jgi:type II pantothenate kinase